MSAMLCGLVVLPIERSLRVRPFALEDATGLGLECLKSSFSPALKSLGDEKRASRLISVRPPTRFALWPNEFVLSVALD